MMTMIRAKKPFTQIPAARPRMAPQAARSVGFRLFLAEQFHGQHAGEPPEEGPGDERQAPEETGS